jgi:hypothetical protein
VFSNPAAGLNDLPESLCAHDQYATSQIFEAIAGNAALGTVKTEIFYGDYVHGDTVPTPVSQRDNYIYKRSELAYAWCLRYGFDAATGQPSQKGAELWEHTEVNAATGVVTVEKSYYVIGGKNNQSNDGILAVSTVAVRGGVPAQGVPSASTGVQSAYCNAAPGSASATLTLPAPPTPGNTLVFIHAGYNRAPNGNITPPAGLTLLSYYHDQDYQQANIWSRLVEAGDVQAWTFAITLLTGNQDFAVIELTGAPTISAATGPAGAAGSTALTSNFIGASGPSTVLCMFEWETGSSPGPTASGIAPSDYSVAYQWTGSTSSGIGCHCSVLLSVSEGSVPAAAVTATLGSAPDHIPVYATVIASIPATSQTGSVLKLAADPSPYDRPADVWDADNPLTDTNLVPLLSGSKYAVVDVEIAVAEYHNGQTVPLMKSAVSGYNYSRAEQSYFTSWLYTGAPDWGPTTGRGQVQRKRKSVDPSTGVVTCEIDYNDSAHNDHTNDGIIQVITIGQRARTYANSFVGEAEAWVDVDDTAWLSGAALATSHYHDLTKNVRFATEGIELFLGTYADGDTVPLPTGRNDGHVYTQAEVTYVFSGDDSGSVSDASLLNETISVDPDTGLVSYKTLTNTLGLTSSPELLVLVVAIRQSEVQDSSIITTPADQIPTNQAVDGESLAYQALANLTAITVNGA